MKKSVAEFPLAHFEELIPLLMRCFPAFWGPRLARGVHSFPYDLKLFCMELDGQRMGTAGIHEYPFLFHGAAVSCGGLCDVGIDPDFRGHGYAGFLQEFALAYCRNHYPHYPLVPLYTDKPAVYKSHGWQLYEPDRLLEIRAEDFPKSRAFCLNVPEESMDCLRMKRRPQSRDEEIMHAIQCIYAQGILFNGKCLRSAETWRELFSNPEHEWVLENQTYFLYRGPRLLEAYSTIPDHPSGRFIPAQGGYGSNKIMLNLQRSAEDRMDQLEETIERKALFFPIADTF